MTIIKRGLILLLLLTSSLFAQGDWMEINDYSGGMNLTAPKGGLPDGQFLQMVNFVIHGRWLEVREGLTVWLSSVAMSDNPIIYMSSYQTRNGWQMIASDGYDIWIIDDSTDFSTKRYPSYYSEYTCSTTAGDSFVYGNSDSLKWLSLYGYGDYGLKFVIDTGGAEDTFDISHILNDTMLILTDTMVNTQPDSTFKIPNATGSVTGGVNYAGKQYLATAHGLASWNGDSFTVADTALEPYRYYCDSVINEREYYLDGSADPGCGDCDDWEYGQFNGWYWQFSTGNMTPDTGWGKYANHYVKTLHKVNYSYGCKFTMNSYWGGSNNQELSLDPVDDQWGYLTQRIPQYSAGRFNTSLDTSFCIILKSNTDSGAVWYWGTDIAIPGADSAYFESGDYALHVDGYPSLNGRIFFLGGLPPDTIDKWQCWPITALYRTALPYNDTVFIYTDKNYYIYKYEPIRSIASTENAYEYLEVYRNRLFFKLSSEDNFVHWSERYYMDSTLSTWKMKTETNDGDWVTALMTQGDYLNIYKNNSILQAYPTNVAFANQQNYTEFFDYRIADDAIGCIAPKSLVAIGNIHYFLSNDGFAAFDGTQHKIISEPIRKWLEDSLNLAYVSSVVGTYFNGDIFWSVPKIGTDDDNDYTFVYHVENGAWTRFDYGAASFAVTGRPTDTAQLFIASPDSGIIAYYGGSDDYGDSIVATLQTDYYDFDIPQQYKVSRELFLAYNWSSSKNMRIGVYGDYGSSLLWSDTLATTSTFGQFRLPFDDDAYGRNLSLELKFYDAAGVKIPWLRWFIKARGKVR